MFALVLNLNTCMGIILLTCENNKNTCTTLSFSARIQKEVEINPKFEAITTAMADFTPPSIPLQQKPKIPADNIQRDIAPFNDETTSKMTYKEWPVMPPKHPIWAKKPVYKRRTGGFVTKSIYAVCINRL